MARETVTNRRKRRVRFQIKKAAGGRHRLSIFRSNANISAQIIDDKTGITLASSSTQEKDIKGKLNGKAASNIEAAKIVGQDIAEKAKKAKVESVVFDRGSYLYHGRVKALADAAREAGLTF